MRYAILHTPRTGSNVLCDCLVQTGLAGMKDLYDAGFFIGFGEAVPQAYTSGAVDAYFERNRTDNEVEGCKLGWDYIEHLNKVLAWGEVDKVLHTFDRFIFLTREDLVAQAVSRMCARLSGKWTSLDEAKDEVRREQYNVDRITYFICQTSGENQSISDWLRLNRSKVLHMTYEENSASWKDATERVLRFIGHEGDIPQVKPKLKKMKSILKREWIYRYNEEAMIPALGEIYNA